MDFKEMILVDRKWDNSEELSKKFVKPTGENRKIIFYKCLDN